MNKGIFSFKDKQERFSIADHVPVGSIIMWPSATLPFTDAGSVWWWCSGAAASRIHFPELYEVIGTTYGSGDGITTHMNFPLISTSATAGKIVVGKDGSNSLGQTNKGVTQGGSSHSHGGNSAGANADHAHSYNKDQHSGAIDSNTTGVVGGENHTHTPNAEATHTHVLTDLVINYIIRIA